MLLTLLFMVVVVVVVVAVVAFVFLYSTMYMRCTHSSGTLTTSYICVYADIACMYLLVFF